jgi:hypothetical protein
MNRKKFVMYVRNDYDKNEIVELLMCNAKYEYNFTKDCVLDFLNDGELVVNGKIIDSVEEFYDFMTY